MRWRFFVLGFWSAALSARAADLRQWFGAAFLGAFALFLGACAARGEKVD